MPVDNGRQNNHGWWGTLTLDAATVPKGDFKEGDRCVFVKTNADSHFVAQGTFINRIRFFSNLDEAIAEMKTVLGSDFDTDVEKDLYKIGKEWPDLPIVEILEIDSANTSPLTTQMNILTEVLFNNAAWLRENGSKVGEKHVKKGRKLRRLP
jgi:hypothetical protein